MKKIFRKIHLYMALFTIPVGIMIGLTGALYVLGADQNTGAEVKTYTVNQIIPKGEEISFLKEKDGATEIITTDRSLLGKMIMLHKAKCGILFKIMMVLYGIVLVTFYVSGLIIAVFKKNVNGKLVPKTENYVVIAAGFIVTIILAVLSL